MKQKMYAYDSEDLVVEYDLIRCIHAEECVRGLPTVFDPSRKPWMDVSGARPDAVAQVILDCPTGALRYRVKHKSTEAEVPAPQNTAEIVPDGPLYVAGELRLVVPGEVTETRIALCRCGESSNKPFCDGAHSEAGFSDPGVGTEPTKNPDIEPDSPAPLKLIPLASGPILIEGRVTVRDSRGVTHTVSKGAFCRCSHSRTKPFCDGSHVSAGFVAPQKAVEEVQRIPRRGLARFTQGRMTITMPKDESQ